MIFLLHIKPPGQVRAVRAAFLFGRRVMELTPPYRIYSSKFDFSGSGETAGYASTEYAYWKYQ